MLDMREVIASRFWVAILRSFAFAQIALLGTAS
jgi:hypothetical protein